MVKEKFTLTEEQVFDLIEGYPTEYYEYVELQDNGPRKNETFKLLVVRRKEDGKLFGYQFTASYNEGYLIEDPCVFQEVTSHTVTRYKL